MTNKKLQNILSQYSNECEILIKDGDYETPRLITVEYAEDEDFVKPKIIICI